MQSFELLQGYFFPKQINSLLSSDII